MNCFHSSSHAYTYLTLSIIFIVPKPRSKVHRILSKQQTGQTKTTVTSKALGLLQSNIWLSISLVALFILYTINSKYNITQISDWIFNPISYLTQSTRKFITIIPTTMRNVFLILWTLTFSVIRYSWIILLMVISKSLVDYGRFPSFEKKHQAIADCIERWHNNDPYRKGFILAGILFGPFLIKVVFCGLVLILKPIPTVLWALVIFAIRYEWILLLIIVSNPIAKSYRLRKYRSMKEALTKWYTHHNLRSGILIISVLAGPFLLEKCLYYSMPIIQFVLVCLWKLIVLVIRYEWLVILLFISEVLVETGDYPNLAAKYRSITDPIKNWHHGDKFRSAVIMVSFITCPFLLEKCLYYSLPIMQFVLVCLWKLIVLVIRYEWLIILLFISEVLVETGDYPYSAAKYRSITDPIKNWHHGDNFRSAVTLISIITCPFLLEACVYFSIPIIKFILICLWTVIIMAIRYGWLVILLFVSEVLVETGDYPNFATQYRSITNRIKNLA